MCLCTDWLPWNETEHETQTKPEKDSTPENFIINVVLFNLIVKYFHHSWRSYHFSSSFPVLYSLHQTTLYHLLLELSIWWMNNVGKQRRTFPITSILLAIFPVLNSMTQRGLSSYLVFVYGFHSTATLMALVACNQWLFSVICVHASGDSNNGTKDCGLVNDN